MHTYIHRYNSVTELLHNKKVKYHILARKIIYDKNIDILYIPVMWELLGCYKVGNRYCPVAQTRDLLDDRSKDNLGGQAT